MKTKNCGDTPSARLNTIGNVILIDLMHFLYGEYEIAHKYFINF